MKYTENVETSTLYRKWVGIMCISAALQRKVKVEWGVSLTFYPNLYIILVGKSATGKGTAMRPGLDIIKEIPSIKLASQATSLQALISNLKDNNLSDISSDGGMYFHSSMTVYSEEFTVFLGYKNNELISALCNWYDCEEDWEYNTIKRSKEKIHGVWVNLIGGTTPDLIRSSLPPDSIGGGLTSRIIFIYAEKADHISIFPTETPEERELFKKLVLDLETISLLSGDFSWTKEFMNLWAEWRKHDAENPPFQDSKFDGYCGRRKVHVMKLSMVMSVARQPIAESPLVLTGDDLKGAIALLNEAEKTMALTFRGMGKSDLSELIFRANMFFKTSKTNEISYRTFARYFESDADKFTLDRMLDTLEAIGTVQVIKRPQADTLIKILEIR
uniref:Putative primase n=1 Tax=viral metagenome TaxID=1070528 RepID=A0A6M3KGA7_9ZZZZ